MHDVIEERQESGKSGEGFCRGDSDVIVAWGGGGDGGKGDRGGVGGWVVR